MDGAIWVDAFKVGDLVAHPRYGKQRYTEPQLREAIENFRVLKARGYATTLLREHGTQDSYIYGEIIDLRIDEHAYFQCLTRFTRKAERDAYNEGILREFSPGFASQWLDPHTGETLNNVLIELSFTSRAYQRNLRPPQATNPGVVLSDAATPLHLINNSENNMIEEEKEDQLMDEPEADEEKEEFNQEAAYSAISGQLEAMSAMLEEMRAFMMPEEPEAAEMADDVTEVAQLSARLADVESENARLKIQARGISGDDVDHLVKLSAKLEADEFEAVVERYSQNITVQAEIGAQGAGVVDTGDAVDAIIAEAAEAGFKYSDLDGRFSHYIATNHPEDLAEVMQRVKE